ncbi:MAG: hypothetical protein AABW73_03975 [Nanoarchaeota archaeon]
MPRLNALLFLGSLIGIIVIIFLSDYYHDGLFVNGRFSNFSFHDDYQTIKILVNGNKSLVFTCYSCDSGLSVFVGRNVSLFFSYYNNRSIVEKLVIKQ